MSDHSSTHRHTNKLNYNYLVSLRVKNILLSTPLKTNSYIKLVSTAERRGTPVLLSASVSDNSGNSPQMAALRRSCEIDNQCSAFMLVVIIHVYLAMNMADYMDVNF